MAKVSVILFTYKKYKNGKSPIMLRITKNKQLKYFKIGDERFDIEIKQWNKEYGIVKADKRLNPDHVFLNGYINEKLNQVSKIIAKYEERRIAWTFNMLEEDFKNKPKITKVKPFIESRIKDLQKQERYKSSTSLKEILNNLEKYNPSLNKLYFQDIDHKFIEGYYTYLKNERGNKDSTIGIMLRGIRAILNEAINQGVGSKETYPFSKIFGSTQIFKISKLENRANKRFIPKEFMIKLVEVEIPEPHLNWARQIFLFSFFASGINFKDMAFLKDENIKTKYIDGDKEQKYFELNRRKTNESLSIPITENLKQILTWAKMNSTNDGEYLLPIITNKKLKGEKLNNHITQRRKRLNMHLRTITEKLEFPEGLLKISSYYARHSYATTMLRNGVQIEKISEALGHTNIKTTQNYLESFGLDEIARMNENLLK